MSKFLEDNLMSRLEKYFEQGYINIDILRSFKEQIVWKAITESLQGTKELATARILNAETLDEVRMYQGIVKDITFFIEMPDVFIKSLEITKKELDHER